MIIVELNRDGMSPRGDGYVLINDNKYHYWYRVRVDQWFFGVHINKPTYNHLTNIAEYDDAQLFHDHQSSDTYIRHQQVDELVRNSLQRFANTL